MKISIYLFFNLLSFALCTNLQGFTLPIKAKAAIVYNPRNQTILFKKNIEDPHYPASIMKIATALFVLDQKKIDLMIPMKASSHALEKVAAKTRQEHLLQYPPHILEHDAMVMGLKVGDAYTLDTLLHGLLMTSGADAANVIAENSSGSIEKFMEELNAYLLEKKIYKTHFQNPHGLFYPTQITTAYDMAKIASLAYQNPVFCKIISTKTYQYQGDKPFELRNDNRFIRGKKPPYPKAIGGKTGYTASSGFNLVAFAKENDRHLIVVLLGCKNGQERFQEAIRLFEAAFQEKEETRILFSKGQTFFRNITAKELVLQASLNEDVALTYYPSEEVPLHAKLEWKSIQLPILKGEEVGRLVVENDRGEHIRILPLFAQTSLKKSMASFWIGGGMSIIGVLSAFFLLQRNKKSGKFFKR